MRPLLREVRIVFQDPYASLDPRMSMADLVAEPLAIHGIAGPLQRHDRVAELLRRVGLAAEHARHPHEAAAASASASASPVRWRRSRA